MRTWIVWLLLGCILVLLRLLMCAMVIWRIVHRLHTVVRLLLPVLYLHLLQLLPPLLVILIRRVGAGGGIIVCGISVPPPLVVVVVVLATLRLRPPSVPQVMLRTLDRGYCQALLHWHRLYHHARGRSGLPLALETRLLQLN